MNALETAQCLDGRAGKLREGEIELGYFVAGLGAGVGDGGFSNEQVAGCQLCGDGEAAVAEGCVAQAIAEGIKGLPSK